MSVLERVRREVERNRLRARNGIRMATGVGRPPVGQTPKDTVWRHGRCELWHYRNDNVRVSPPLLIVFSLVSRSYILDLTSGNSFIEHLLGAGFDVYMLDWGVPDERDAANRLEDYSDEYIPAAIERVREVSGTDEINLLGYCFGGVLTLLHAAHSPDSPLRSLTVMATPVDFGKLGPMGDALGASGLGVDAVLDDSGNVPAEVMLQSFRSLEPTAQVTSYVDLLEKMWSEDYVAAFQAMNGWATDHIPLPGGVARQLADMLMGENAMMTDRLVLGGDRVHLADIRLPLLNVISKRDHIVPPPCSAPLLDLVGSEDKHELRLDAGHVGLAVGRTAHKTTIPQLIEFLRLRSEVRP